MATSPISLSSARKARANAAKASKATENAAKFGRSKLQKHRETEAVQKSDRFLDGHRIDPPK